MALALSPCCCGALECPDVGDAIITTSGVTDGSNCTTCDTEANDSFLAVKLTSIEFPLTSCNDGTVIDISCVWVFYGTQNLWTCSFDYRYPIMQFSFFETSTGTAYAQLQIGDDIFNDVHTWFMKEVAAFGFPVEFDSGDRQTTSPCTSNNNACNWSAASITIDLA